MKYPVPYHHLRTWCRFVPLLLVCLVGCSGGKGGAAGKGSAVVKGVVKFNGTPLPGGVVTFASESNPGQPLASGSIETDGSYRVQNLPKGGAVIAVQGPSRSSKQEDKDKPFIVIPVKYQDAKESGLKLTVQDGEQVFDIDLTSLRR